MNFGPFLKHLSVITASIGAVVASAAAVLPHASLSAPDTIIVTAVAGLTTSVIHFLEELSMPSK